MNALDGKVVVISGGTSGIGARTAELFVAEGARVVIAGRRRDRGEQLAQALGKACSFVRTDVSIEADVRAMIAHALERFGQLDCLFNNAGLPSLCPGFENLDLERFDTAFAVHVRGVLAGMKYAVPVMTKQRSGSIINTSSINGSRAGLGGIDYAAAKAAVDHLTRCAAVQLGERGIRVNTISPGPVAVRACKRHHLYLQTSHLSAQIHCTRDARSAHAHCQRTHIHCTLLANIQFC